MFSHFTLPPNSKNPGFASLLSSCNWLMALRVLQLSATEDVPPTSAGLGVPWQFTAVWKGILVGRNPNRFSDVTKVREWYFMNSNGIGHCWDLWSLRGFFVLRLFDHFVRLSTRFFSQKSDVKFENVKTPWISWSTWITLPYNQKGCLESMLKPWLQLLCQDVVRPWCPGCKAVVGIGVNLCGSMITSQVLKR